MTSKDEIAQKLADHIQKTSQNNWPGAVLLEVIDGSPQWSEGYVWCDNAGSTVRCIVPSNIDLTGGSHVIYAIPLGVGPSAEYICLGLSWNGVDDSRIPPIRTASITDINGDPVSGGGGTVTSVALSLPGEFAVSGSPVTTSGTLTGAWNAQTATHVLAGPTPSFRALAAADIPDISATYVLKSLFDAQTVLAATTDDTPAALTVTEQTVVGRATGGNVAALAIDSDLSSVSGNDDTVPSAKATKAALDTKAASSHAHAASDITSGTLAHEQGGLEFDASAVSTGDLIVGTGAGTMALLAASGASDGDVPTIQGDGTLAFEAQSGGNVAAYENGVEVVAAADKFDFKDLNVEDAGSNDASVYHNLPHIFQARLTLESGVSVSTSDQTAKTTVYLTPHYGNKISLYDGTRWQVLTLSEISIPITDSQTGDTENGSAIITNLTDTSQMMVGMEVTGAGIAANSVISTIDSATQITLDQNATATAAGVTLTFKVPASTNVDIWVYNNSGTAKLEGLLWTDGTTRATALTTQDNIYVKTGAVTRRLCGTIATTTTAGQTEISTSFLGVSNAQNRVSHRMYCVDTTDSWTYAVSTWRAANANTTIGQGRIQAVLTLDDVWVSIRRWGVGWTGVANVFGACGIGIDSTSVNSGYITLNQRLSGSNGAAMISVYDAWIGAGAHYVQSLEISLSNTCTFLGDGGDAGINSGLSAVMEY